MVGLEETVFSVTEDTSSVELCVIVYQPNAGLSCPIDFEFDVTLSTEDDTAGKSCLHGNEYLLNSTLEHVGTRNSTMEPP